MHINIGQIIVVIALTSLAYWVNEQINYVPFLKNVVRVVIVVAGVLLFLAACGLIGGQISIS